MSTPHPPPPASVSSSKSISTEKAQPIPWTHQETVHLIHAYQEKWYSLERGQLKSSQWEEVAVTVAARCGYSDFDPSKTSVQCRHKMEKLRQRFRSEKHRLSIGTQSSSRWLYFDLMSNLLRGPLPISARPMSSIPFDNNEAAEKSDNYNSDYEEEEEERNNRSKSKSISNILRRPIVVDESSSRRKTRNSSEDEDEEDDDEYEEEERNIRVSRFPEEYVTREAAAAAEEGKEMCSKLAAEIRLFADRLEGMESLKMEMMKEAEMNRIAMENRRIEMILESEKKIVNSIAKAFGCPPSKRLKIGHDC
ncbi:trihelix transcription factor ASIL1 [Benincasa hispida]|uniref:trihelix transcription factor ASIL1 n=1 Tax=Benincasa hispida TaxID=102211 RepID=UPI0019021875|nr:trihelix transcription factor ASIL1 [Benincasa hispida]